MKHRGRALARLIGVKPPGHAFLHCHNHGAQHSSRCRPKTERAGKDLHKYAGKLGNICQNNDQAAHHIEKRHGGNQSLRHMGQTFKAAQSDDKDQHNQDHACCQGGNPKIVFHYAADGIGLDKVSSDDLGHHKKRCQHRQPGRVQSLLYVIHGAAHIISLFIALPVKHAENNLPVFGGHAQKGRYPHPEDCAHSSGQHGCGHAYNIAASHTGSHRRTQCLERRDGSLFV